MTERDIFMAVLDLPDASSRAAYLDRACKDNPILRKRVESLLQSHDDAGSFLCCPAVTPSGSEDAAAALTQGIGSHPRKLKGGDFLSPSTRPDSLGRIGHYEILQVLGRGAFGIVFRAFDETLHRMVAVKVLRGELAANATARKRFIREARAAASLCHEHVVNVFAVDEQPIPHLVMEYVHGQTLQDKIDQSGPLSVKEVLRIGQQIANGLAAAHAVGLIHRDIKPANILLENSVERVKISDFGLARTADDGSVTQSGVICGTPMYMAPEQAADEQIDARADLFSLGSVMYAMCAGFPPFRASNTLAVLKRVCEETPRPIRQLNPDMPKWLCDIIARLHQKKPANRYASAREVADLLARSLIEHGQAQSMDRPAARRSGKRRWATAVVVLLVSLVGLGFSEASGVTRVSSTVIRLFSPQGTLVVEVDDPGISVTVDGDDTIITGTGAKEIRLKPGKYKLKASKDGKTVREELVSVERNGKRVVRVSRESQVPQRPRVQGATEWAKKVAALPAEEQIKEVVARLKQLNPDFELTEIRKDITNDQVTHFEVIGSGLRDLSPIRALPAATSVGCVGDRTRPFVTPDLSGLVGLNLRDLGLRGSRISDIRLLADMQLVSIELSSTQVSDLSPLAKMPLTELSIAYTPVSDLSPLKSLSLEYLNLDGTKVENLTPLAGQRLKNLWIRRTKISDLSPLKGMPLEFLDYANTPVTDISPLKDLPLKRVKCDYQPARDGAILRSIKTLEMINKIPVEQFWKEVDGK